MPSNSTQLRSIADRGFHTASAASSYASLPQLTHLFMADSILAEARSPASNRRALVCDEGASVWFYLTDEDGRAPIGDCWLFNTVVAPADLSGFTARGLPPPATSAFAKSGTQRAAPDSNAVVITWSADGHGARVHVNGTLMGFIDARDGVSQGTNIAKDGPYGDRFDERAYASRFQTWWPDWRATNWSASSKADV